MIDWKREPELATPKTALNLLRQHSGKPICVGENVHGGYICLILAEIATQLYRLEKTLSERA